MIKWFQYALKLKKNLNHYYSRFDTSLNYGSFKKKIGMINYKYHLKQIKIILLKKNFSKNFIVMI